MLTIKAEIKRGEQKNDGTYNVKLRFTLDRKVRRLSTSLFVKPEELTKTGQFKKNTKVYKDIEKLVTAYQEKCNAMQTDLNNYSLDYIFKLLRFHWFFTPMDSQCANKKQGNIRYGDKIGTIKYFV